ncbi:carbamoylphosphate synthase large subunit [Xylaria nigripes]|nr:carbamoylphosphate synthase large subunit [Xylaria nigripes]
MAWLTHHHGTVRCFGLVFLSFLLLPLSLAILCFSALYQVIDSRCQQPRNTTHDGNTRRTILVTGVGMAKGLTLARAFYLSGHRVIGADFDDYIMPCSGRFSKSLSVFRRLSRPSGSVNAKAYTELLKQIVEDEGVDLWVSCSGVASAIEDARAKETIEEQTSCRCVQFDVTTTAMLHAKNTFMRACTERDLLVPDTHEITSKEEVLRILAALKPSYPDRKYILKPIGIDDANRGDMTLLPLSSDLETRKHVTRLPISTTTPWILQQFIPGDEEYCTHALIVRGELKCFVVCPSSELLMHYVPLPRDDARWHAICDFTLEFLECSENATTMTGHLSFDFKADSEGRIYAIECNPRAHTAVVLFAQQGPEMQDMVRAYLSVMERPKDNSAYNKGFDDRNSGDEKTFVMPPVTVHPRFWIGNDVVTLLVLPLLRLATGSTSWKSFSEQGLTLLEHVWTWKEGSFEVWDPIPAFVLYHVYWPLTILSVWWHGHHWSRINVSTTKIFTY